MIVQPYTVHEAEIAVYHAWGDGGPAGGPLLRHLQAAIVEDYRVGMKVSQVDGGEDAGAFGEWRRHAPGRVSDPGWVVEVGSVFGAMRDGTAGEELTSFLRAGMPVVMVARFVCADTGVWRVFQFHDCVVLPTETGDEAQWMRRTVRFSAGHLEEFKSGAMPSLEPRLRGVIEWRHLGRVVRCWEYDAEADLWEEDAENSQVVEEEMARYVNLDFVGDDVEFSYMAARTVDATLGGVAASGIGWMEALAFSVGESSGLTLAPGWLLETEGCAEPLLLPPSGRHWEHPRVVFRFLGRIYATIEAGVIAMPSMTLGEPDAPLDFPIRLGGLLLYPEGAFEL